MKSQREKIIEFATNKYGVLPEFLWEKFPTYAVLRNKENKKWFTIIMRIPKNKLGLGDKGEVEVMNIKCKTASIWQLLDEPKGFLPAYHMNKKYWISVLLDGSVNIDRLKNLVAMSYDIIAAKKKA